MIEITTSCNKTLLINKKYIIAVTKANHTDYASIVEVDYISEHSVFHVKDSFKTLSEAIKHEADGIKLVIHKG